MSDSPSTDNFPQRYWIWIALFFAIYLAGVSSLIFYTGLWSAAQPYAAIIIQHPAAVRFFTCILCSGCAWFFFWPREGSRFIGRWSDYIGLAFATFAVQYGFRFIDILLDGYIDKSSPEVFHYAQTAFHHISIAVVYICSALNNLLFFAASRILLRRSAQQSFRPNVEAPRVLNQIGVKLRNALAEFREVVPKWAIVWAVVAQVAVFESRQGMYWARYPDAFFSLYCLSWFGYAIAVNLNMRRRKVLAALAMIIALIYGGAQLVYATNPVIAYAASQQNPTFFATRWVKETIGNWVNKLNRDTNEVLNRDTNQKISEEAIRKIESKDGVTTFLDNAVYAVLLPMKLALFLPAFSLYLLFFIISINDVRPALFDSIERRKDYLSSDGIVRAIANAIGAEKVSLYIRIPGSQELPTGREERALPLVWDRETGGVQDSQAQPISIKDHPILKRIMRDEGVEIFTLGNSVHAAGARGRRTMSQWWWPIKFHGGVIGALQANLVGDLRNHITLQKFRLMTDLIAPSVQDYRSLAAMDQMGFRFTHLQVEYPKGSFEDSTKRVAGVLHDVLSPRASGLIIEIGFCDLAHYEAESEEDEALLREQKVDSWREDGEKQLIGADKSIMLEKSPMVVRIRETNHQGSDQLKPLTIGGLMFTIPAHKDEFSRPTLAAYYLNRKALASLAADNVFDLVRDHFSDIVHDLGVEYSKEPLSHHTWFAALQSAVLRSGIQWVIAAKDVYGEGQDIIALDSVLSETEKTALFAEQMSTPCAADIPTSHTISIALTKSKYRLWFGVKRAKFGAELKFDSPWRVFLSDLAKVADAALDSIKTQQEAELALQNQGVITIAVTTGTLMHQIVNMIRDQLIATDSLVEETRDPSVRLNDRCQNLIRSLRTSALHGRELTEAFKSITQIDGQGPWPCVVKQTAEAALKLYRVSLKQRNIEVIIDLSTDILADVPFFVPAFTLANLIGNARDAIWAHGWIRIEAEERGQFVECHVTNNGPEIPPDPQKTLFEFGKSNKDGHNGWGLYFVKRALIEYGGDIWLAHSDEESTSFTILLPRNHSSRELNGTSS
jgi:signal transduction histidine kinase